MNSLKTKNVKPITRQRGFTLLLAALVASIVLAIGSAIFSIAMKEVTLSSVGKNSQYAFYAADTGAECALFWDTRTDIHEGVSFASSSASAGLSQVTCDNQTVTVDPVASTISAATTTFYYAPNGYCVQVTVAKSLSPVSNGINTIIHSDGYSTIVTGGAPSCTPQTIGTIPPSVQNDPNALQRSVELHY